VLFDTGQGLALPVNLAAMELSPADFDAIVLSHGHWDHGGGLEWLANAGCREKRLFAHPQVLTKRLRRVGEEVQDIGLPSLQGLLKHFVFVPATEPQEILPGVGLTGEITQRHPEEASDPALMIDTEQGPVPDPFWDEIALFLDTEQGVVVITGCAHAGVVATVEHVLRLTGDRPIAALIGGFHLMAATADRIAWTAEHLRRWNIGRLAPLHCTGFTALAAFQREFGDRVVALGAGDHWEIG
jgi:7,8-dihydropterin-6-yl-methyl-4-(beta-D-ribofuranosyl)aminobenzene 5'-phosphate synthase